MKKLISLSILLTCLLFGCGPSRQEIEARRASGEIKTYEVPVSIGKIYYDGDTIVESYPEKFSYTIVKFQHHEYIRFDNGQNAWGAHSGACPNPIHRYNPDYNNN